MAASEAKKSKWLASRTDSRTAVQMHRRHVFAREYAQHLNVRRAAISAGYALRATIHRLLRVREVEEAVNAHLAAQEAVSQLKAEYIREYILSILEFCPTDYFYVAVDGSWAIDPEKFKDLPHKVKRLVERVELKFVGGTAIYSVVFMSKTAALAMAARYTLGQYEEHESDVARSVPWDEIAGEVRMHRRVSLEERIVEVSNGTNGANGAGADQHGPDGVAGP
jgi:Terminase small subunit